MSDNVIPLHRKGDPPPPVFDQPAMNKGQAVLILLAALGEQGQTSKDLARHFGWHHGSASGVLSRLHLKKEVVRLAERRDGAHIYVLPAYVNERRVSHRQPPHHDLTADLAAMLRRVHRPCDHSPNLMPHPTCRSCEIRELLARYDRAMKDY